MKIGLIKERKNPPDKRVVLTPVQCGQLMRRYPQLEIFIESSEVRVFRDEEYLNEGVPVVKDMSDCDVLMGVKEVPVEHLLEGKRYFFFSHTIKKQPYNQNLLQEILKRGIEFYDHELIKTSSGKRLVAFGRYAGIVGVYNGFRAYGLRYKSYELPKAHFLRSQKDLIAVLSDLKLPPIKVLLTGKGKVGMGALEMLVGMGLKEVSVKEYLKKEFDQAVFTQIDVLDYTIRKDQVPATKSDFFLNPQAYVSNFMRFARNTDLYIAGHFYGEGSPFLFTREDCRQPDFKIKVVADISCDINGPVASTIRASSIEDPFYGYDPKTEKEVPYHTLDAITVMAVDNLPCELPLDASEGFGQMISKYVIPALLTGDRDGILERAKMTQKGQLLPRYKYLQDYVDNTVKII